ncbi:2,3-diaminopropionate biosynthesis protein SbnA [Pricia sp. S334]|uniref:N-(2-amino-2-carboxyethyl)-L-glutamate synthase n=1 Tax=Pricia mediterranea TaxID=3076079 RepID=A0ABU3L630_9FLAO|nr:2,3-diaminopropionate biosynthesis protein SbnA [Pricia sp. S334]MDT7828669.1 2,3-diaminopropionate biosynthesis protein SbnA [Pricia sp. S334]
MDILKRKESVSDSILQTIGKTPLVRLHRISTERNLEVFAKLEGFNPSGSVKDRTSFNILKKALDSGELKRGHTVVESSSGNMAIGLAQACLYFGLKLIVVVDPKLNEHTAQLLRAYGAKIERVSEPFETGGFLAARLARVKELLIETENAYWSNQYGNWNNPLTHHTTMEEIFGALEGKLDYLFVATSTCGTLMGCANFVSSHGYSTKVIAVDALGSKLFGGKPGKRMIPGHGAGVDSQFMNASFIHDHIKVSDLDCVTGCWELLKSESILCGGSSGAILSAFKKYQERIPDGARSVFLMSDRGDRYLDTIYSQEWLLKNIPKVRDSLSPIGGWKADGKSAFHIAIVGLGPKGLYGLERLLAQISETGISEPVEIHLFNKNEYFGAGDIYRPDQPPYLIMNFANAKIDIRPDKAPAYIVPDLKDFRHWLAEKTSNYDSDLGMQFSSRATVGAYLSQGFDALVKAAPDYISIIRHVGEVTELLPTGPGYQLRLKDKNGMAVLHPTFQNVLLTTGHAGNRSDSGQGNRTPGNRYGAKDGNLRFANGKSSSGYKKDNNKNSIDFVYPVDEKLGEIPSSAQVGCKGIGLTFIDVALAMTEGRGGTFRCEDDDLSYIASGKEPKTIFPFSRSGLPMIPRTGRMPDTEDLRYFTPEKLKILKNPESGKFNFREDLLPEIVREFTFRYYRTAFRNYRRNLNFDPDYNRVQAQIDRFHSAHPHAHRFTFKGLCNPFDPLEEYGHRTVQGYLNKLVHEVSRAEKSPLLAAISAWHDISPLFNSIYSFGGLDPHSHEIFDFGYAGLFNRLCYGPPLQNMKKVLALIKAGIIDFSFGKSPELNIRKDGKGFELLGKGPDGDKRVSIDYLIDARIPKTSLNSKSTVLYRNLSKQGLIRPFQNKSGTDTYLPGCLALDKNGHPIGKDGSPTQNITVYGTPTEGIVYDNDTLSRRRNDFASGWAKETTDAIKNHFKIAEKSH